MPLILCGTEVQPKSIRIKSYIKTHLCNREATTYTLPGYGLTAMLPSGRHHWFMQTHKGFLPPGHEASHPAVNYYLTDHTPAHSVPQPNSTFNGNQINNLGLLYFICINMYTST